MRDGQCLGVRACRLRVSACFTETTRLFLELLIHLPESDANGLVLYGGEHIRKTFKHPLLIQSECEAKLPSLLS